jgi:hypothetical protein
MSPTPFFALNDPAAGGGQWLQRGISTEQLKELAGRASFEMKSDQ